MDLTFDLLSKGCAADGASVLTWRTELAPHVQYVAGRAGRAGKFNASDVVDEVQLGRPMARAEHFREAVEGRAPAANLLMRGMIRLVKESIKDPIENVQEPDSIVRNGAIVPTNWDA